MGEAKRRRATGLEGIADQHLFDVRVVYATKMPALWAAAAAGDRNAACRLQAVHDLVVRCSQFSATDEPMLCLLCDYGFTETVPPPACVVVVTRYDHPEYAICNAVCDACQQHPDLLPRIVAQYRKSGIIGDARIVPPLSQPGHA